jgi:hypothetical protein
VTENPIQIEDPGPREGLIPQMGIEDLFRNGFSHDLSL